ncbi:MAG: glycoside hydrolase family 2 protein [Brevinema sp.]
MEILHPNPQAARAEIMILDGSWDFCFDKTDKGLTNQYYLGNTWGENLTITVPYVYQSPRSGIGIQEVSPVVWYRKLVKLSASQKNNKNILHIGASDYCTTIFINGQATGTYKGGYNALAVDISPYIKLGENLIVIRVEDQSSPRHPMGKQSLTNQNFACWYTQNTGIWQSVWLESIPHTYIKDFRFIPHVALGELECIAEIEGPDAQNAILYLEISGEMDSDRLGNSYQKSLKRRFSSTIYNNLARFRINIHDIGFEIPCWSPEHPNLCNAVLSLESVDGTDTIHSYFGYRNIELVGNQIYLNGRPYFQKLILNQGYYGEGLLTGTEEEYLNDIRLIKEMGFNGQRIHQKTESARYLYLCDREGLLCWAEMASPYSHDTFAAEDLFTEIQALVRRHANHPCVVAWTPFNESWGVPNILNNRRQQQLTLAAREMILALDEQGRPVISNDGWEHTVSDILTIHDYEQDADIVRNAYPMSIEDLNPDFSPAQVRKRLYAQGFDYNGEPVHISEYGGIAFQTLGYSDKDWGYGTTATNLEEFYTRFEDLHDAFFALPYVSGVCYTQLTDVQQEINGLLDHNHRPKFDVARIAAVLNKKRTI